MSTLPPVPNSQITIKDGLTPSWKSWFFQLYTYVTQQIGSLVSAVSPVFTGTMTLNGTAISTGSGSPNSVVTGNAGDLYIQTDENNGTLWVKQTAGGNTGWFDGGWYGSFYDITQQTAASTTVAYAITFGGTAVSSGVTLGSPSSNVYVTNAGIYNIQFSAQLENTATTDSDVQIWIRQNGNDVPVSNSIVSIPSKHGAVNGHTIVSWNWVLPLAANDYFTLMWQTSATTTSIQTYAAGTTPTTPVVPSMLLSVTQI